MMKPHDPTQTQRLMLAVVFSLVIMLGFELFGYGQQAQHQAVTQQQALAAGAMGESVSSTLVPHVSEVAVASAPVVQDIPPLVLENDLVRLSYDVRGGKLVGWVLKSYTQNGGDTLGYAQLHQDGDRAEYAESGWLGSGIEAPGAGVVWQVQSATANQAVLVWSNASGQTFTRTLTLANDYTLKVEDTVANTAALPVNLSPYAQVHRAGGELPNEMGTWISYHGPMGVTASEDGPLLHEFNYSKLADGKDFTAVTATSGWWGVSSHYFLSAWVPEGWGDATRDFRKADVNGQPVYSASVQGAMQVVPAGGKAQTTSIFYAGPKQEKALLAAGHNLERAIDWGWFRALARPFYTLLLWFHGWSGSWALAIVLMTLALKIATFPLANKSYHAMAKMKKLQPQMEAMKERFKDDQQGMALEMMKLYRDNKVNPLSGCWPMLIQIPIFFAMYKVVLLAFEFRHASPGLWPLDMWVHDLSLMDPWFILPVLMGASMFVQMRLNPPPTDPAQAMVFKWMPVIFTVMFLWFPAALVWYWLVNNVFSIAQQYWIMRGDKAI